MINNLDYICLYDMDSTLYHSVYRIVSISDMKALLSSYPELSYAERKQKAFDYIIDEAFGRMGEKTLKIFDAIEETGIKLLAYEYYITACKNSVRKQISDDYKAKRKGNKYVSALRKKLIQEGTSIHDDVYEADDLIADRALELKSEGKNYIVVSIDKDLKQIEGYHFDYYPIKVFNEETQRKEFVRYKGLSYTSKNESYMMIALQMLMGDAGDGVLALKGIGQKKAEKILEECKTPNELLFRVVRAYINHFGNDYYRENFLLNLRLLKLGKSLQIS